MNMKMEKGVRKKRKQRENAMLLNNIECER